MGLALDIALKFYTSVAKGSKLKVRKFWGLVRTFVEVIGEKLVRGLFAAKVVILWSPNLKFWSVKHAKLSRKALISIFRFKLLICVISKPKYVLNGKYAIKTTFFVFQHFGQFAAAVDAAEYG